MFSPVPVSSKKKINEAGKTLVANHISASELNDARDLASQWRACHAYPINTFQSTLRRKLQGYPGEPIVAQRLKRMPTIIDKLKRYPNMKLATMQDIGGIRAVLESVDEVYKLASEYKNNSRFAHELIDEKDYISNPRDEDGYRSLHLIYKYRNTRNPNYDGLRLELQIRSKLQHTWATAVETMGTLLGQALKSRQGDQQWLDFFAIVSSAFTHIESTPAVPRYSDLSWKDTSLAIADVDKELGAIEKMKGFSVAADYITRESKGRSYHLIILDSLGGSVSITSYGRDDLEQAMLDYSRIETEAAEGKRVEPVLVSAGPIDTLRRAYPNFFLDIGGFVGIVGKIVAKTKHKS